MPNLTKEVFDATASNYDRDRARLIPGCDAFYRWAVDLIPAGAKTIVDLGAGSGLLTLLIRQRFPKARIHLIDFSRAMLDLARQRLGDDANLTFAEADYANEPIPTEVCAVVSSLSIHHLENEDKRRVFRKANEALKPRGVFVNADQVAGPTPELDERYRILWLRQARELGATDQQVQESLYRQQQDRCVDVGRQLGWMREAGFGDADCWYKEARFAVMAGTKR
jgi:tRNA (cmo5U34)-methyltransferase